MIDDFRGEYRWLSNFHLAEVSLRDVVYPSNEHAYMAAKTLDHDIREQIRQLPTPREAKAFGRKLELRQGWNEFRIPLMQMLCMQKFFLHPDLRQKLIDTGDQELVEGNTWGDTFWGVCKGKGENNLGKILMRVRDVVSGGELP